MSEPLRILRVTSSIYPEVMGGVGLHTHHLSKLQARMGHKVTVLTSDNGDRTLPHKETRSGYELVRYREVARPLDNSIIPGLVRSLRGSFRDYDVIHIHSHLYFSSNLAAMFAKFSDRPVIVTNHGLVSQTAPRWLQRLFNPTLGKFTFDSADRILCYTETDRDRLIQRGIKSDISVIHNGIDCSVFRPQNTDTKSQILFVGRLKPGKGVIDLINSFGQIAVDYPNWELKIVGDGPLYDELQRIAEDFGVSPRVSLTGEIPNEKMPQLYDESAIFTLPSLSEGLPRTVLEAMACETPVVTSSLPQLKPIVDGAGLTVDPSSPKLLANALTQLLDNSKCREQMGKEGRQTVVNNYSWHETVNKTVNVYQDLL